MILLIVLVNFISDLNYFQIIIPFYCLCRQHNLNHRHNEHYNFPNPFPRAGKNAN